MIPDSPYLDEVIQAHVAIEHWFAGTGSDDALAPLLGRFCEQFSMITPAGRQLDKTALAGLFGNARAAKPGFRISLSELQEVARHDTGATVSYREHQVDNSGTSTERLSTAVFTRQADGKVLWRHLHETFCTV